MIDLLFGDDPPCAAAALAPSSHATGAMTCLLEDPRADGDVFPNCDVLHAGSRGEARALGPCRGGSGPHRAHTHR